MSEKEYSNINTARRAAVSKAWVNERSLIIEGKGTRDWSRSQQAEIVATGKCKGYFGHHKCSVSKNPKEAGNKDNIQFLNAKEHFDAHNGNYKNDSHGRYDPKSKKLTNYEENIEPEPIIELSHKMAENRKQSSIMKYNSLQKYKADKIKEDAAKHVKSYEKRTVKKELSSGNEEKTSKALRAGKAHNTKVNTSVKSNFNAKSSKALSSGKTFSTNGKTSVALSRKPSSGKANVKGDTLENGSILRGKLGGQGAAIGHGRY